MVKRGKLVNTGNENEEVTHEGNEEVGGFAPGVAEQIAGDMGEGAGEGGDTEQDIAEQEAAGVIPDKPTRPAATPASNGSNQQPRVPPKNALTALKRKVQELGEKLGGGKTSMIALAEAVTEAAQEGTITVDLVPDIYDRFRAGASKGATMANGPEISDEAAMGIAPAKSLDQQLSKLRQFVILGNKYDQDALDLIYRGRDMHLDLLRAANTATDEKGKAELKKGIKPGSTYSVLVDVARAQLKKHKDAIEAAKPTGVKLTSLAPVLTNDELRGLMTQEVKEPVDKTGEDYLLDTLIKARATAKGSNTRNAITCEELDNAIDWLRAAMGKVAPDALAAYDAEEAAAVQAKADAAEAKRVAEEEKARKAAEPKPSKAERQAALVTTVPAQQGNAQPVA